MWYPKQLYISTFYLYTADVSIYIPLPYPILINASKCIFRTRAAYTEMGILALIGLVSDNVKINHISASECFSGLILNFETSLYEKF